VDLRSAGVCADSDQVPGSSRTQLLGHPSPGSNNRWSCSEPNPPKGSIGGLRRRAATPPSCQWARTRPRLTQPTERLGLNVTYLAYPLSLRTLCASALPGISVLPSSTGGNTAPSSLFLLVNRTPCVISHYSMLHSGLQWSRASKPVGRKFVADSLEHVVHQLMTSTFFP
jgi:hypothetical protein